MTPPAQAEPRVPAVFPLPRGPLLLVLVFVVLNCFFVAALTVAQLPSSETIGRKLSAGFSDGRVSITNYPVTASGHTVDAWLDCVALGIGTVEGDSPLRRAIESPHRGACPELLRSLRRQKERGWEAAESDALGPYFRIWHGYQTLSKPTLVVAGVGGIRMLGAFLLASSALLLGFALSRELHWISGVALVAPLVLFTDFFDIPGSFPHAVSVSAALSCGAAMWFAVRRTQGDAWLIAATALACGAVFCFLDFVIHPPMSAMLTAFAPALWTIAVARQGPAKALLRCGIATAGWIAGYVTTWSFKWLLAVPYFGFRRVYEDVTNQILFRASFGDDSLTPGFGETTWLSLRKITESAGKPALVASILVAAVLLIVAVRRRGIAIVIDAVVVSLPALIPLAYFEFARDQVSRHAWFMYRSLAVSVGIVLATLVVLASREVGSRAASASRGMTTG